MLAHDRPPAVPQDAPPDGTAPAVPRDSSPTWELEMLISGAVLYSLFQLPPLLDGILARWQPHATYMVGFGLMMLYAYLKGALYTLIAAFVIHLGVRAYWVGLIGLDSVFSRGIQWDRTSAGPIAREVYRERMPTLPRMIARLDNFASIIFSFAFLVVMVAIFSVVLAAGLGAIGWLVARITGGRHVALVTGCVFALFIVPGVVAAYVDRLRGARLAPGGRAWRVLHRVLSVFYKVQLMGVLGPVLYTISSNGRRRTTYALFYLVLLGSLYLAMGEWVVRRGALTINGADYFSMRADAHAMDYAFYESQWAAGAMNESAPSIQADIIRDPYVRLFIPYQPERHNLGVAARCPGLPPLEPRGIRLARPGRAVVADSAAARVLDCLAGMHAVRINGSAVSGVTFRFAEHPRTGVDGIVAYLPTAALPRGENMLTVMPPPRRPGSSNARPLEPWRIPFWL